MAELKLADYKTTVHNDWCPGCGDFGILEMNTRKKATFQRILRIGT